MGIAAGVPFKKGAFTAWDYDVELASIVRLDAPAIQSDPEINESDLILQGVNLHISA